MITLLVACIMNLTFTMPTLLPKQHDFVYSMDEAICYGGGVGSGKTIAGVVKALWLSILYDGNRGMIGAKTYPQLRDAAMLEFFKLTDKIEREQGIKLIANYRKSDKIVTLINGSTIEFRQCENEDTVKGPTLGWYYIDEATNVSESVFYQLEARLRLATVKTRHAFCATNPAGKNHWVYRNFARGERDGARMIKTSSLENILSPDDYKKRILKVKDQDWHARYVLGEWGAWSGLVYKEFDRDKHVLPPDWTPTDSMRIYRSIDWGYRNPFCCLWIAVDYDNRKYVFDEHYEAEQLLEYHCPVIMKRMPEWRIAKTFYDSEDPGKAKEAKRYGLRKLHPAKKKQGSVLDGIEDVKLSLVTESDGHPNLMVHPRCENFLNEIEGYEWLADKGGSNSKEEPLKHNDHAMDAYRYFEYTEFHKKKR